MVQMTYVLFCVRLAALVLVYYFKIFTKIFALMDKTEVKRKSIPGTRELIVQIKQISNDITSIDAEIDECKDKIHTIIVAEKSTSPRAKLTAELREISDAKSAILNERRGYMSNVDDAKNKIETLRNSMPSNGAGFNSIEKINKALEDLELKLISTSISAPRPNSRNVSSLPRRKVRGVRSRWVDRTRA